MRTDSTYYQHINILRYIKNQIHKQILKPKININPLYLSHTQNVTILEIEIFIQ